MISSYATIVFAAAVVCRSAIATEDLATKWSTTLDIAGRQRMLSQKMSKEFAFIAAGVDVATNIKEIDATMNLFETSLWNLINGDSANGIIAAPSDQVSQDLHGVVDLWADFKKLLQDNVQTVRSADGQVNNAIVEEMATKSPGMLTQTNKVVESLVAASHATGLSLSSMHIDIAGRQRMLIQRMSKELILIALNASAEANIANVDASADLFDASHEGLLLGRKWADVDRVDTKCALRQMGIVASNWHPFQKIIIDVVYASTVSDASKAAMQELGNIASIGSTLFSAQVAAVKILVTDDSSCDVISDGNNARWAAIINSAGKQRMLTMKAVRLFLLVVAGVNVESSQFDLLVTTTGGTSNLRDLIEGNPQICPAILSPPTEEITAQLLVSYDSWANFAYTLSQAQKKKRTSNAVAKQVGDLGLDFLTKMNAAAGLYADLVTEVDPLVPAHIMNFAGRQRMLLQKMAMHAIYIYRGVDTQTNWIGMNASQNLFVSTHRALLRGDDKISRQTDICIVQQLNKVELEYAIIDEACLNAAQGNRKGVETLAERSDIAFKEMNAVVTMLVSQASSSNGGDTCDAGSTSSSSGSCVVRLHSMDQWKLWIRELGRLRFLTQKVAFTAIANPPKHLSDFPAATYADVVQTMETLLFGSGAIAAPQSQEMINYLIHVSDTDLQSFGSAYENISFDRDAINAPSLVMMEAAERGMIQYIGAKSTETVPRRMNVASRQIMYIYKMAKEALLASDADFDQTLKEFEAAHGALLNGGYGLPAASEENEDFLEQWEVVDAAWQQLGTRLQTVRSHTGGRRLLGKGVADLGLALMSVEAELNRLLILCQVDDEPIVTAAGGSSWTIILVVVCISVLICCVCAAACFMELADGRTKIDRCMARYFTRGRNYDNGESKKLAGSHDTRVVIEA